MNLTLLRRTLSDALQIVLPVVPTRTTKEICKNIKAVRAADKLTLIATDMEVTVSHDLPCEGPGSWEALLPAARTASILRELPDGDVTLSVEEDRLTITTESANFSLSTEKPQDFPAGPIGSEGQSITVPGQEFRQAIRRVQFAADLDATRYALAGAQLTLSKHGFCFAATDSRRLAVSGREPPEPVSGVIPSKVLSILAATTSQDIGIELRNANFIDAKCGETTIRGRLLEGRFPRWQDVIPTKFNATVCILACNLLSAVRQAMIVQNPESKGVDFVFGEDLLTLESKASDVGSSKVQVPIEFKNPKIIAAFDPKYVADFLKVLQSSQMVEINLIDGNAAALFSCGEDYRYVVMPLARD